MTTFVALYRGESVPGAKLVAVSADPDLIAYASTRLLKEAEGNSDLDPVLSEMNQGRQRVLRLIKSEAA